MESTKNHYRKVFKSDHLGSADLEEMIEEGKQLIFTIKEVKQEFGVRVAGKKMDANIAYFKEAIKPLVINATNSKILKGFSNGSPFVEDWSGLIVQLYIDPTVKMKGEVVGGVRIMPTQPKVNKTKPVFTRDNFNKAKEAGATIEKIQEIYDISESMKLDYEEFLKS